MQEAEAASQQEITKDSIGGTGQDEINEEVITKDPKDKEIHYNVNGPAERNLPPL